MTSEWRRFAEHFGDKAASLMGEKEAERAHTGELAYHDTRTGKKNWEFQCRALANAQKDRAERERDPNEPRSQWFSL